MRQTPGLGTRPSLEGGPWRCSSLAGGPESSAMGGMGGGDGNGTMVQVAVSFIIFGGLNLFLNFFNKWALSPNGGDFHFAFFYSMFHMIMSAAGSFVLMLIKPPSSGLPSVAQFLEYKWELAALALCTSVNIGCNNASLIVRRAPAACGVVDCARAKASPHLRPAPRRPRRSSASSSTRSSRRSRRCSAWVCRTSSSGARTAPGSSSA